MGACLSKNGLSTDNDEKKKKKKKRKNKSKPGPKQDPTSEPAASNGAALPPLPPPPPPPPPEDEAVVKEVLTETPVSSLVTPRSRPRRAEDVAGVPADESGGSAPAVAAHGCGYGGGDRSGGEASEVCSVSGSFSVSTTLTDKMGEGGEGTEDGEVGMAVRSVLRAVKWKSTELSPSGKRSHQRRRSSSGGFPSWRDARGVAGAGGGGGPRSSPLPAKEANKSRQQADSSNAAARVLRKDHGDRSGRRSASPAAKREVDLRVGVGCGGVGVSRSLSTRRASPQRAPPPPGSAAGNDVGRKRGDGVEEGEGGKKAVLPAPRQKESLENPLVSMECFIFL